MPISRPSTQHQGAAAEQAAASFLQEQGLRWLQSNFSCKLGEIDLIMQDREQLVFVEVRFRSNDRYGGAAASVTPAKQLKIRRTAQIYLSRLPTPPPCRFDVVAMKPGRDGQILCENWIQNAF